MKQAQHLRQNYAVSYNATFIQKHLWAMLEKDWEILTTLE